MVTTNDDDSDVERRGVVHFVLCVRAVESRLLAREQIHRILADVLHLHGHEAVLTLGLRDDRLLAHLALATLQRLHEVGITKEELQSAKTYIKGQFPPEIETTDRLAATIAELEFFGLDEREVNTLYPKVDAMTRADAKRIIREYFPLEKLVFVLIGKASEIEPVVKKYAKTLDKKGITEPGF